MKWYKKWHDYKFSHHIHVATAVFAFGIMAFSAILNLVPSNEMLFAANGSWSQTTFTNSPTPDGTYSSTQPYTSGAPANPGNDIGLTTLNGTGGTITYSGSYTIHTFTSSGTFTPASAGNVEALVVAGGGGGGTADDRTGGGGGAGGLIYDPAKLVTTQAYTITVGLGGGTKTNGSNSSALDYTAVGGGYGASGVYAGSAGSGGSGGGAKHNSTSAVGTGTADQGYKGGKPGYDSGNGSTGSFAGCGGGGAGAAGNPTSTTTGGAGGVGVTSSITGLSTYYAGGGGGGVQNLGQGGTGGAGGLGGGGVGGLNAVGGAGIANTGGGGGGGGDAKAGGSGGSGIVIIRYVTTYVASGTYLSGLVPDSINPTHAGKVYQWGNLTYTADVAGAGTALHIHVYQSDGVTLVPDSDLANNSTGFTSSPISLATLNNGAYAVKYASLKIRADLSTSNTANTPYLNIWDVAYSYDITAPTVPTALTVGAITATTVPLSWTASTDTESGVAGYEVQRAPDSAGSPGTWAVAGGTCTGTIVGVSCTDSGLSVNTKYWFRVRAKDSVGLYSNWNDTASGGTITYSGAYVIHAYTATGSSTFVPTKAGNVEVLVVAGGGSGSKDTATGVGGSGGGAGGLVYQAARAVTVGNYSVTIGNGGAGQTASRTNGNPGSNSVFDTITAGGGGYAGAYPNNGGAGGSGGGAGAYVSATGGPATQANSGGGTGFGNKGGNSLSGYVSGTGGGGAGAAGANIVSNTPTAGGIGKAYSISGTSTYYAGGGGATTDVSVGLVSAGGLGGGGAGVIGGAGGIAGTANTGGGGGGTHIGTTSGVGGSGIVIIRYTPYVSTTTLTATPTISAPTTPQKVAKPTIVGTGATPSTEVRLYDNGTQKASMTADGSGNFIFNASTPGYTDFTDGDHTNITVRGNNVGGETGDSAAVTVFVDTVAPDSSSATITTAKEGSDSGDDLVDADWNGNNNGDTVYFAWSGATDPSPSSSIKRYWVYFGPLAGGVPRTDGVATADATAAATKTLSSPVSGTDYYLRIQTEDNAGNISSDGAIPTLFVYKFDNTEPSGPTTVSVDPVGWNTTNEFDFAWTNWTETHSGMDYYLYVRKETAGGDTYEAFDPVTRKVADNINPIQLNGAEALFTGVNYLRLYAIDKAGNTSSVYSSTPYFYSGITAGPTITPTPTSNTINSFGFDIIKPVGVNVIGYYCGVESSLSYSNSTYIKLSELPKTVTINGDTTNATLSGDVVTLSAFKAAKQQGINHIYCATEDEFGNIGWSTKSTSDAFTINTIAPDVPQNIKITDSSDRGTSQWSLTTTWVPLVNPTPDFNGYEVWRCVDADCSNNANYSKIATTDSDNAGFLNMSLNNTKDYYYRVKSKDNVSNTSAFSSSVHKIPTGKYTTPPTYTSDPSANAKAMSVKITWTTNRASNTVVQYGLEGNLNQEASKSTEEVTDHEIEVSGLNPGTDYKYKVQSLDADRDYDPASAYSDEYTFKTLEEPGISEVEVSDVGLYSTIVTWKTTSSATSRIKYGTTTSYGKEIVDHSGSSVTTHTVKIGDLNHSTLYHFKITGTDVDGNNMQSDDYAFSTLIFPVISNVKLEGVKTAATSTMKVVWESNVPMTSVVEYKTAAGASLEISSSKLKTKHEMIVAGLKDNTKYILIAKGRDAYGNQGISGENRVTTDFDTRPPEITNVTVETETVGFGSEARGQIIISWETDEPATSQVEYGLGSAGEYSNRTQENTSLKTSHVVIISDLKTSSPYHLRMVSRDESENEGFSDEYATLTSQANRSILDAILNALQNAIGWLFG